MRNKWLPMILLLAFVLAACGQQVPATPATAVAPIEEEKEENNVQDSSQPIEEQQPQETVEPTVTPTLEKSDPATCTALKGTPTPNPTIMAIFPPITEEDHVLGPEDAKTTFMEYSNYQCPHCASAAAVLKELHEKYPDEVRIVMRVFPFPNQDKAFLAAQASEAADLQGKFWEMSDLIFGEQQEWYYLETQEEFETWLNEQAAELGLDEEQFAEDIQSEEVIAKVTQAQESAIEIGIPYTPFFMINNQPYDLSTTGFSGLEAVIQVRDLENIQYSECPAMTIDPEKEYTATLHLEEGDVVIELLANIAPVAVNSFVFLAREGWFDGIGFHRVIPGFVAQTGDPSNTGMGNPGYYFDNEIDPDYTFDDAGVVGMANAGPTSNGSQFFITYAPVESLNGKHTIFGHVIDGMDVVEKITPRDSSQGTDNLPEPDKILSVTIEEK